MLEAMYSDSHEPTPAWFIVRAKPKQEGYAQTNLAMRHLPVFLPRIIELGYDGSEAPRRKPAALFPGYLFVRLQLPDDYYRVIWTPGVKDLVALGGGPVPVPDGWQKFANECGLRDCTHNLPCPANRSRS